MNQWATREFAGDVSLMTVSRFKSFVLVTLLALIVLWVLSWVAARWLIVDNTLKSPADVIVVLSGSSAFRERTQLAAEIFRQGYASSIVLTNDGQQGGWSNEKGRNPFTFELAMDALVQSGVPANRIKVIRSVVTSTHDEASTIKDWTDTNRIRSIVVVTSAYHGRRAVWTFQRDLGSSPAIQWAFVPPGKQTPRESLWWFYPKGWQTVALEYVKLVYYRLRY